MFLSCIVISLLPLSTHPFTSNSTTSCLSSGVVPRVSLLHCSVHFIITTAIMRDTAIISRNPIIPIIYKYKNKCTKISIYCGPESSRINLHCRDYIVKVRETPRKRVNFVNQLIYRHEHINSWETPFPLVQLHPCIWWVALCCVPTVFYSVSLYIEDPKSCTRLSVTPVLSPGPKALLMAKLRGFTFHMINSVYSS